MALPCEGRRCLGGGGGRCAGVHEASGGGREAAMAMFSCWGGVARVGEDEGGGYAGQLA